MNFVQGRAELGSTLRESRLQPTVLDKHNWKVFTASIKSDGLSLGKDTASVRYLSPVFRGGGDSGSD